MPAFSSLLLAALAVSGAIGQQEYKQRRARLRQALPDAVIVLKAAEDRSSDPRDQLLAEPNFFYLTGWPEPGAVLMLLPESTQPNEILFLPPRNERKERYEGRRGAPSDPHIEKQTGFSTVLSTDVWEAELRRHAGASAKIYSAAHTGATGEVKRVLESREVSDAGPAIARLRMVKSPAEIALLERAIQVSIEGHLAAWKRVRSGMREFQLSATMTSLFLERGCERNAYRPVIASGPNSVILHYSRNRRRMNNGDLLLMDVGAECGAYAADLTRTLPVGGRFTQRQRELYQIVLGAQKAAVAAAKPGETLGPGGTLTRVAKEYMDKHGKDAQGDGLGKYFTHGIGHHVGLEVHDAWTPGEPLAPGMVITIEPGLYFPEEGIGIRIEDMVLITENGAKLLSGALPREASEIERHLSK
jgi:Xaa-Pro aminopeptidase